MLEFQLNAPRRFKSLFLHPLHVWFTQTNEEEDSACACVCRGDRDKRTSLPLSLSQPKSCICLWQTVSTAIKFNGSSLSVRIAWLEWTERGREFWQQLHNEWRKRRESKREICEVTLSLSLSLVAGSLAMLSYFQMICKAQNPEKIKMKENFDQGHKNYCHLQAFPFPLFFCAIFFSLFSFLPASVLSFCCNRTTIKTQPVASIKRTICRL